MKKYLILIAFQISLTMFSQEGVELPLNYDTSQEILSGTYIKDIDLLYNPYIGIWETVWDNKKLTLKFEKATKELITYPNGFYYYRDLLVGKYKIQDLSSGVIYENDLELTDIELIKIKSLGRPKNNEFNFIYIDSNLCDVSGKIYLTGNPLLNQLEYDFLLSDFWFSEDCPYITNSDIPIPIPTGHQILNKIN